MARLQSSNSSKFDVWGFFKKLATPEGIAVVAGIIAAVQAAISLFFDDESGENA